VHPAERIAQRQQHLLGVARRMTRAAIESHRRPQSTLLPLGRDLARLFRAPPRQRMQLEDAQLRWQRAGGERVVALARRLGALEQNMRHLNPESVLERGYSIVTGPDGSIVQDAAAVSVGDEVGLRFARGGAAARITRKP
jgi:exodeoxyribonuclease VII large subunit